MRVEDILRLAIDVKVEVVAGRGGVGSCCAVVVESSAAGVIVMLGIVDNENMVGWMGDGTRWGEMRREEENECGC